MVRFRSIEDYPFVVRMSTQHSTKTWYENPAFQRLTASQRLLIQSAVAAEFFPFEDTTNANVGEVVSAHDLSKEVMTGNLWRRHTAIVPVVMGELTDSTGIDDYHATYLSYETRRLHSSGGSVALRGVLPADVAEIVIDDMRHPEVRRNLLCAVIDGSWQAPILTPDFSAIDRQNLAFRFLPDEV